MPTTDLPRPDGSTETIELRPPPDLKLDLSIAPVRLAFAAAHIVTRPDYNRAEGKTDPTPAEAIDWDATLAYRRYLWSLGLGVAEAMDTAQRYELGWETASRLLDRTLAAAREADNPAPWPAVIGGAGADGRADGIDSGLTDLIDEYVRQGKFIQSRGGVVMLIASPSVARLATSEADYVELYSQIARQLEPPVFLHWLGSMFAPSLAGYFPGESFARIMEENAGTIAGVKLSLLDEAVELQVRERLRRTGQIVLTGDDFHYPDLILGDASGGGRPHLQIAGRGFPTGDFSHALLGIFDAIAPVAARALENLARGDARGYKDRMEPTAALSRLIFEPPTQFYKAGVVFLAYLNGHQEHFTLLGGLHERRAPEHYLQIFKLAHECGVLLDPPEAARRLHDFLRLTSSFGLPED